MATERTSQIHPDQGAIDNPTSFGEDGHGNLYLADFDGDVFRLTPNAISSDKADTISGREGDDTLFGGSGADHLDGGKGADILNGNDGNDILIGGPGADQLSGGAGGDTADYSASHAGVNVNLTAASQSGGDAAGDTLSGIENLIGSGSADVLTGDAGANRIDGGGGNDVINGGAGSDTLTGGLGRDTLTGGADADTFDFNAPKESANGNGRDVITDFTHLADHIDLHDIDAITKKTSGNQDFTFIGAQDFHHKAGELHFVQNAGFVVVEGDVDGNGKADFQIEVHGVTSMTADDFIL